MKTGKLLAISLALIFAACSANKPVPQIGTVTQDTLLNVPCYVYLPENYAERAAKEVFPVLYLQHGMWGNETDWTVQGNLLPIMDSLLQLGQIEEMVIIMPDNCPHRPTSEEERANATNGEWEGHFAQFMAEAESKYAISREPSHRAIAGLSMGGYHTMRVSSVLDGQFDYVGMFSPATFVHQAPTNPKVFWLAIGNEDFLYESFQEYRKWLDSNHIEYTYYESAGGHTWPNWQDYIVRFLVKFHPEQS